MVKIKDLWSACHDFYPNTFEDPPCRGAMYVKSVDSSSVLSLVWNLELFVMNSVASTLNRVTDMEFNNQISVLTPNNWNTWKHDMQVLLMHYGCWQFIVQTKPEQPDEEATYKEKN
ncbi:uncharacterized protein TNCV_430581 [Trichonephila clavipes]|nr:uncharacterized protein TNCV_430581 [Trichonephila clavipes]